MITIEEGLRAHLRLHPGVSPLTGNRVYPVALPDGVELPAISLLRVSGPRDLTQNGANGKANPRFQVDVWGDHQSEVKAVSAQIRKALHGFRGVMGGGADAVPVGMVRFVNELDIPEAFDPDEDDTRMYHTALDFLIWHDEDV